MMWACAYCERTDEPHHVERTLEGFSLMKRHTLEKHPTEPVKRIPVS